MGLEQAQRTVSSAQQKRAHIAQTEQAQRKACLQKFAASGCLTQAARDAQDQRAQLRQEENAAKRVLRQERVRQQDERIRQRQANAAAPALPAQKRAPMMPPAVPRQPHKKPPLQGELSAGDIAANEAQHAKRLQAAKRRQEEIEKRVAERAAKKAQQQVKPRQAAVPAAKP